MITRTPAVTILIACTAGVLPAASIFAPGIALWLPTWGRVSRY